LVTGDSLDTPLDAANEPLRKVYSLSPQDRIVEHAAKSPYELKFTVAPTCPLGTNSQPCSGQGTCTKGCCICSTGFQGFDCSTEVAVPSVVVLSNQIIPSEYKFSSQLSDNYKVYWKIFKDPLISADGADLIEIAVQVTGTGWVAFGPSNTGSMLESDIILGWVTDDNQVVIDDYYITKRDSGCPGVCKDTNSVIGGKNNILAYAGNQKDGVTQLKWLRKLKTGDTAGDIDIVEGQMDAIWGYHPDIDGIAKHNTNTKAAIKIDFFKGDVAAGIDLREIHGFLMFFAWAVFIPITAFIARFMKKYKWWFNVHRWVNIFAMITMIAAFIIAILMTDPSQHFQKNHAIIGLTVVIIGCLQPILGFIADKMFDETRDQPPWFPDKIHWILGWCGMGLAMINVILGLMLYGAETLLIAYGLYFAVVMAFLIGFIIYKQIVASGDK